MKMNKIVVLSVIIIVLIFFLINKKEKGDNYTLAPIVRGDIVERITASGIIDPISTVSVGTQVSGTIQDIYVDYNSPVTQGQLLAIIDPAMFQAQVNQQRANLNSAKAEVNVVESELEYNRKNLDRIKSLNKGKFSSDKDLDLAQKEYDISQARIKLQKAKVEQIAAALNLAETELNYTKIISPVDGIIVSKEVEVGQTVAASYQTPTLFEVAEDLSLMQINASVVETDVSRVEEGQKVEFTVDGFPNTVFEGVVIQVRNKPITTQNVVTYEVIIEISNSDLKFKPGMTANVEIITSDKQGVLLVPNKSLRFFISDGGNMTRYKDQGLWVIGSNNPERISVATGISDEDYTEIISDNPLLEEGMKVIVEKVSNGNQSSTPTRLRMR